MSGGRARAEARRDEVSEKQPVGSAVQRPRNDYFTGRAHNEVDVGHSQPRQIGVNDEDGRFEPTQRRGHGAVQTRSFVAPDLDPIGGVDVVRREGDSSQARFLENRNDVREERPDEAVALVGAEQMRQPAFGRRPGADGDKGGR